MHLYQSSTYLEDLCNTAQKCDFGFLKNSSVLITGCTGLIGSALVDLLLEANRNMSAGITVYAAARRPENLKARFPGGEALGLVPVCYDAEQPFRFEQHADYIIHAAGIATPNQYVAAPVNVMLINFRGLYELLEYARATGARRLMFVSSSEVYGNQRTASPIAESALSEVNPLSVRSSYGVSKLASETLCVSYASQYQLDTVIARPGHVYGPTAGASDQRVSSLFPRLAVSGRDIVLKSTGAQVRSYCYCFDCAAALLTILRNGASGEAYNISNPDSIISIAEMAQIIARYAHVDLVFDLPTDKDRLQANPMNHSGLNSERLEALGWHGLFSAEKGLKHTVDILRDVMV